MIIQLLIPSPPERLPTIIPIYKPAHVHGMNECARASIEALRRTLPLHPDTIMVFATGSQADGRETAQSDLDLYHIVEGNKWLQKHYDVIKQAVAGHIKKVDVVVDSPESVGKYANLYGSFEYRAVHDGILIYENKKNGDWRRVHDVITDNIRLPDCAPRWMELARQHMDTGESYVRGGGCGNWFPCMMYAKSIGASLMAALTYENTRFRFIRRLDDMADLLHDRSITCGYRVGMADSWRQSTRGTAPAPRLTADDVQDAARMTGSIYHAVREYTKHGRRSAQH